MGGIWAQRRARLINNSNENDNDNEDGEDEDGDNKDGDSEGNEDGDNEDNNGSTTAAVLADVYLAKTIGTYLCKPLNFSALICQIM